MIGRTVLGRLDAALSGPSAIMLTGLPRIGRTTLMEAFLGADGIGELISANATDFSDPREFCVRRSGTISAIDSISRRHEPDIAALVHAASRMMQARPRLILVPSDAATAHRLTSELIGQLKTIEINSIQPDEGAQESFAGYDTAGPQSDDEPGETLQNRPPWDQETHWLRGGFPESLLADSETGSLEWRRSYLRDLHHIDLSPWQVEIGDRPFDVLRLVANSHGMQFDINKCAADLGVQKSRVRSVLYSLQQLGLVRYLPNWPTGSSASLSDHSIPYLRDSGILHALLGVGDRQELREHDVIGHSWEGFAIEALVSAAGDGATCAYYRDKSDNEIDLVVRFPFGGPTFAVEFKVSSQKDVEAGYWRACEKIGATDFLLVHSEMEGERRYGNLIQMPLLPAIEIMRQTGLRCRARV